MVCVLLAEGFEEIEALCPIDLLRRGGIDAVGVYIGDSPYVRGARGIVTEAQISIDEAIEKFDSIEMLILPGGMPGADNLENDERVISLITNAEKAHKYIAAICAAPKILGKLKLLSGRKAVCYPGYESDLYGCVIPKSRVCTDGLIVTAMSMYDAYEFGITLLSLLRGKFIADKIANATAPGITK